MFDATVEYYKTLKDALAKAKPNATLPQSDKWMNFAAALKSKEKKEKEEAERKTPDTRLNPKVIEFGEATGEALNTQDTRSSGAKTEEPFKQPWLEWHKGQQGTPELYQRQARKVVDCALTMMHSRFGSADCPVDVFFDPKQHRSIVRVKEAVLGGRILLPPCVPRADRLLTESVHPDRIAIKASVRGWGAQDSTDDAMSP